MNNWSAGSIQTLIDLAAAEGVPGPQIAQLKYSVSRRSIPDGEPFARLWEQGLTLQASDCLEGGVLAGTVNGDGLLRVRVTAAAADNTIARVVRLVEEAQESKAPTERFIDRFSRFYTPGVVAAAALVAVVPPLVFGGEWSGWIYKGLAILLIGCPCALVISTPAAIAAALSAGARRGLLLTGGAVLEQIGKITVACFDKTGTLTSGKPQVTDTITSLTPRMRCRAFSIFVAQEVQSMPSTRRRTLASIAVSVMVGASGARGRGCSVACVHVLPSRLSRL